MYFNQFTNHLAAWLLLSVYLFELSSSPAGCDEVNNNNDNKPRDGEEEREFPQLLHMIDATQRVHIVSEMVRDGHRIQVEEFLDLKEFSQLIQFKWHETSPNWRAPPDQTDHSTAGQLRTYKLNTLILNGDERSVLYQYEPFRCVATDIGELEDPADLKSLNWISVIDNKPTTNGTKGKAFALNSSLSALTKLETHVKNKPAKWVSGVAGLWLRAQSASGRKPPYHPKYLMSGELSLNGGVWRLEVSDDLKVDYYPGELPIRGSTAQGVAEAPLMIVLRDRLNKEIQTINVFHIEFNFSNQLDRNLFALPIGYDCPSSPRHNLDFGVYFSDQRSQLMDFELVTTRFDEQNPNKHQSDVKNVQMARARHPLDRLGGLNMFRSIEDRFRIIQDNVYKLEYKIFYNSAAARPCEVQHLQFVEAIPRDINQLGNNNYAAPQHGKQATRLASINSIKLDFSNGIQLDLNEFNMDFLLGLHESDTSRMRLLNVFDKSDEKAELVLESDVLAKDLVKFITFSTPGRGESNSNGAKTIPRSGGGGDKLRMQIVRVYEQELVRTSEGKARVRRGFVEFSRAILFVYDVETQRRIAEIRLNLMENTHLMSSARRAKLFDLSHCHDLEEGSIQLVGYYPADPQLLASISDQANEIIEGFYRSAYDWAGAMLDADGKPSPIAAASVEAHQKYRLGASLNFLRVPKLELKMGHAGELEMHFTILERTSPLDLFELMPNSDFVDEINGDQNQFLVGSLRDCAKRCNLFNCKLFAHQPASRQCKLSRLPFIRPENATSPIGNRSNYTTGSASFVKLVMSPVSEVYYEPAFMSDRLIGEASLAELSSYIEHASEQLDRYMLEGASGDEEGEEVPMSQHQLTDAISSGPFTERHKRSVAPLEQPLFVFNFEDRSNQENDYQPPRRRSLVPSELIIERQPQLLDVAALTQARRVSHTFQTKYVGKAYKLTALDEQQPGGGNGLLSGGGDPLLRSKQNERVFRDKHNEIYYTLKRVASITMDDCALMCYNLNEVNFSRENSEQICDSYSFSKADDLCVLLIKTDYKFVDNLLELVAEGELVLELDRPDQLLVTNFDGVVLTRRYLANFEGPLELAESQTGHRASGNEGGNIQAEGLKLEWLSALTIESALVQDDQGEQCARVCAQRNRRGPDLCLAFDYCFTRGETPHSNGRNSSSQARHRLECKLLLIRGEPGRTRDQIKEINRLRSRLAQTAFNPEGATSAESRPAAASGLEERPTGQLGSRAATSCKRYLMSHLREFNHVNKRQLNQNSREVSQKLEELNARMEGANQEACALECSLEPSACVLFVFCLEIRPADHQVEQRCTLYKRIEARDGDRQAPAVMAGAKQLPAESLTSYHEGCHVFVRREFGSLDEALSDMALDKMRARRATETGVMNQFQHTLLVISFTITYGVLAVSLLALLMIWHRARANGPSQPADWRPAGPQQQPVTIPLQELGAPSEQQRAR